MTSSQFLSQEDFKHLVALGPLVSIDLVIEDELGFILLGKRLNKPAKDFWFVPGGRVLKNEKLDQAFLRITTQELGQAFSRESATFIGVFEHHYSDSAFGQEMADPTTHYVVLGYRLKIARAELSKLPQIQHADYQWWAKQDLIQSDVVHQHTKWYLEDDKKVQG